MKQKNLKQIIGIAAVGVIAIALAACQLQGPKNQPAPPDNQPAAVDTTKDAPAHADDQPDDKPATEPSTDSADSTDLADQNAWNSFTHKAYHYTVSFPKNWYWNGTRVDTLILSSAAIASIDEPLSNYNLKIVKADQIIESLDTAAIQLDGGFKLLYLKDHPSASIIKKIAETFLLNN